MVFSKNGYTAGTKERLKEEGNLIIDKTCIDS